MRRHLQNKFQVPRFAKCAKRMGQPQLSRPLLWTVGRVAVDAEDIVAENDTNLAPPPAQSLASANFGPASNIPILNFAKNAKFRMGGMSEHLARPNRSAYPGGAAVSA